MYSKSKLKSPSSPSQLTVPVQPSLQTSLFIAIPSVQSLIAPAYPVLAKNCPWLVETPDSRQSDVYVPELLPSSRPLSTTLASSYPVPKPT